MVWWRKWLAFFRPVPGWQKRYRAFKGGQTIWDVPGSTTSKAVPFPLAWVPHTLDDLSEAEEQSGFRMIPVTCCDSGQEAPVGVGVLCLRCGVPLHPTAANMYGGFDPPHCKRCKWVVRFLS